MFDWLKFKKKAVSQGVKPPPAASAQPPKAEAQTREELVATALKNMQETRDIIGEEKLQKLAQLILQKKQTVDDTSPAAQAKKIIAKMDKNKLNDFMKLMVQDDQTKH
jgi:hypothetical protein